MGILGTGHGNDPALMGAVIEFGLDGVARSASAPLAFFLRIFGERVATLNHEAFDNAMKSGAIVEASLSQSFEVLDGFGGDVRPKLKDHLTGIGLDEGNFVVHEQ